MIHKVKNLTETNEVRLREKASDRIDSRFKKELI